MLNKKSDWKIIVVLFFCMFFIFGSVEAGLNNSFNMKPVAVLSGDVFYVGGIGPNNYSRIQDAVDNASDGDTVFVYSRTEPYHENVVVNRSIFLLGEDKNNVVIESELRGMAVKITADDVFVGGFTMIHPVWEDFNNWELALVDIVSSENVTIRDNIIQQALIYHGSWHAGIIIRNSSYCFIQNNTIGKEARTRLDDGIALIYDSAFNNISGNEIYNFTTGIYSDGSDNIFYMNYLHHNLEGIHVDFDDNNTIINNTINFNNRRGIWIDEGHNNIVTENIITSNGEGDYDIDWGIGIIGGSNNYISYNHISDNNPSGILIISDSNNIRYNYISNNNIGVFCDYAYNNDIVRNNFIQNGKNGYFDGFIYWRYRNIWKGNYWDEPRTKPYPIFGIGYFLFFTFNKWVVFDWHPAKEPYDI
jgi:nitrous oxidase accessory protein